MAAVRTSLVEHHKTVVREEHHWVGEYLVDKTEKAYKVVLQKGDLLAAEVERGGSEVEEAENIADEGVAGTVAVAAAVVVLVDGAEAAEVEVVDIADLGLLEFDQVVESKGHAEKQGESGSEGIG